MTRANEFLNNGLADEACSSGDEDAHYDFPPIFEFMHRDCARSRDGSNKTKSKLWNSGVERRFHPLRQEWIVPKPHAAGEPRYRVGNRGPGRRKASLANAPNRIIR
ncbi:hypothetical protein DFP91_2862 [Pseudorhodoplanes sinuspersici]|nr:hypothetical protein DFP91_2862 [Pseudorhodoplanes sinuspersici]